MKKLFLLLVLLLATTLGVRAIERDSGGNYLIGSAQDLKTFALLVNNGNTTANAILTADIDLQGSESNQWTPIGSTQANSYKGTFDGQGHTVKNLYYKQEVENIALIGHSAEGALIKNVRVQGSIDISNPSAITVADATAPPPALWRGLMAAPSSSTAALMAM